jgi:hypothetical protein
LLGASLAGVKIATDRKICQTYISFPRPNNVSIGRKDYYLRRRLLHVLCPFQTVIFKLSGLCAAFFNLAFRPDFADWRASTCVQAARAEKERKENYFFNCLQPFVIRNYPFQHSRPCDLKTGTKNGETGDGFISIKNGKLIRSLFPCFGRFFCLPQRAAIDPEPPVY